MNPRPTKLTKKSVRDMFSYIFFQLMAHFVLGSVGPGVMAFVGFNTTVFSHVLYVL